jgi:hypothetical protein
MSAYNKLDAREKERRRKERAVARGQEMARKHQSAARVRDLKQLTDQEAAARVYSMPGPDPKRRGRFHGSAGRRAA